MVSSSNMPQDDDIAVTSVMLGMLFFLIGLPLLAALFETTLRIIAARARRTLDMKRSYAAMGGDLEAGMNVDLGGVADAVVAPTSPCFADPPPGAARRRLVLEAQRLVLAAFCNPELRGVVDMPVEGFDDGLHRSHQDPHGVLFASLLAVRRGSSLLVDPGDLRPGLSAEARMRVVALTYATRKMHANTPPAGDCRGLVALLRHFLLPADVPKTREAWWKAMDEYASLEARVVADTPLLYVAVENPLTHLETELCKMVQLPRGLSPTVAKIIRAAAFFVFGAAVFNPAEDVLELINTAHSTEETGRAAVRLLLSCWYVAEYSGLVYREPHDARVDGLVRVLVRNCLAPHAGVLRFGNYTDAGSDRQCVVRRMLAPTVLHSVARIYGAL